MVKAIYCWKHISRRPIGQAGWMMLEKIHKSTKLEDSCPRQKKMERVG
jgi:hypothetical protein